MALACPIACIQIQHLLKLNQTIHLKRAIRIIIQIQHLLKLNSRIWTGKNNSRRIQIQHLLKLNAIALLISLASSYSNTTLVKVKCGLAI